MVSPASRDVVTLIEPSQPSSVREGTTLWDELSQFIYFAHNGELWRGETVRGAAVPIARIPGRQIVELVERPPGQLWLLPKRLIVRPHMMTTESKTACMN